MKKSRQQGMTLIEVLATLIISSVVLGVAYTAFSQVTGIGQDTSTQTKEDDAFTALTNTLTDELSSASELMYLEHSADEKEWRYKSPKRNGATQYLALLLTKKDDRYVLTRYQFSDDDDPTNDQTHFTEMNKVPARYAAPKVLSDGLKSFNISLWKNGTSIALVNGRIVNDQQYLRLDIARYRTLLNPEGVTASDQIFSYATVKLLSNDVNLTVSNNNSGSNIIALANERPGFVSFPFETLSKKNILVPLGDNDFTQPLSDLVNLHVLPTELDYVTWYSVRNVAESAGYTFSNGNALTKVGREGSGGQDGASPMNTYTNTLQPVTHMQWNDAIVWLNAWSEIHGLHPVYRDENDSVLKNATALPAVVLQTRNNGYRLPTSNEWEVVARYLGATKPSWDNDPTPKTISTTNNGLTYYWLPRDFASGAQSNMADETKRVAWYLDNAENKTQLIKTKGKNAYDLYDVSGNVAEWTFSPYLNSTNKIVRGGEYKTTFMNVKIGVSVNNFEPQTTKSSEIGFRPVQRIVPRTFVKEIVELEPALVGRIAMGKFETEQYKATVVWDDGDSNTTGLDNLKDGKFKAHTTYTATITLAPKPGYAIDTATMDANYFTVKGALSALFDNANAKITATYKKTDKLVSETVTFGFAPVAGESVGDQGGPGLSVLQNGDAEGGVSNGAPQQWLTETTANTGVAFKKVENDPDATINGNGSFHIKTDKGKTGAYTQEAAIKPNATYRFSGLLRCDGCKGSIYLKLYGQNDSLKETIVLENVTGATQPLFRTEIFTTSGDAIKAKVYIQKGVSAGAGATEENLYADDIVLYEVPVHDVLANGDAEHVDGNNAPSGWETASNQPAADYDFTTTSDPQWLMNGNHSFLISTLSDADENKQYTGEFYRDVIVKPNTEYRFSGFLTCHRCKGKFYIKVYNKNGDVIATKESIVVADKKGFDAEDAEYLTIPFSTTATAYRARISISKGDSVNQTDPKYPLSSGNNDELFADDLHLLEVSSTNLVLNGDAERVDASGDPVGWTQWTDASHVNDYDTRRYEQWTMNGTGSFEIRTSSFAKTSKQHYGVYYQDIPVKPNTAYRFSGNLSCHRCVGYFYIDEYNDVSARADANRITANIAKQPVSNEYNTKHQTTTFTTKSNARSVRVHIAKYNSENSTNTDLDYLFADDVKLEEVTRVSTDPEISSRVQYAATLESWEPALVNGQFQANTAYTAKIKITTAPGYTLFGIPANYFNVKGIDAQHITHDAVNDPAVRSLDIAVKFNKTAKTITDMTISLPSPKAKEKVADPSRTVIQKPAYTALVQYTRDDSTLNNGRFKSETAYRPTLKLRPNPGHTFFGVNHHTLKVVDPNDATVQKTLHHASSPTMALIWDAYKTEKKANKLDIAYVPEPGDLKSAHAGWAFNGQLDAPFDWTSGTFDSNNKFIAGNTYDAKITLTPKKGFTLFEAGKINFLDATPNLIENGDAEQVDGSGRPVGWERWENNTGKATFTTRNDTTWTINGARSFEIYTPSYTPSYASSGSHNHGVYYQDIIVKPNTKYRFNGKMSCHRCKGVFYIDEYANGVNLKTTMLPYVENTGEVQNREKTFTTQANVTKLRIHIVKLDSVTTTDSTKYADHVFADDLSLIEIPANYSYIEDPDEDKVTINTTFVARVDAPSSVNATYKTHADKIVVSWSAVNGAQSYDVYRWNGATWDKINSSNITALTYADTGTANGKTTYYRVVAKIGTVGSDLGKSPQAKGMRLGVPSNPSAVSVSKAWFDNVEEKRNCSGWGWNCVGNRITHQNYTLNWSYPYGDDQVTSYSVLYQKIDMSGSFDNRWYWYTNTTSNTVDVKFGHPEFSTLAYRFMVIVNNNVGNSTAFSQHILNIGYKYPYVPTGQDDTRSNSPVAVTGWVSYDGASGYNTQTDYSLADNKTVNIQKWMDGKGGFPNILKYFNYDDFQVPLFDKEFLFLFKGSDLGFGFLKGGGGKLVKGGDSKAVSCSAQQYLDGQCMPPGVCNIEDNYILHYYPFEDGTTSNVISGCTFQNQIIGGD